MDNGTGALLGNVDSDGVENTVLETSTKSYIQLDILGPN